MLKKPIPPGGELIMTMTKEVTHSCLSSIEKASKTTLSNKTREIFTWIWDKLKQVCEN